MLTEVDGVQAARFSFFSPLLRSTPRISKSLRNTNHMMGIIQEKLEAFRALVAVFFLRLCRKSPQQQLPPPPSANVVFEIKVPESLPQPPMPSVPSPSLNAESERLNNFLAAHQQLQQWQGAILTFCFSFALEISLQCSKTNQCNDKELPLSFVLLSFSVLLIFCILLVALFIGQNHARTSQVLVKVAVFLTAAAFCYATTIHFPLKLKLTTWILFLISSFVVGMVPIPFNSRINNNSF